MTNMISLRVAFNSLSYDLGTSFEYLGYSGGKNIYLSYDKNTGWSFVHLNIIQRIIRRVFKCYSNTHLNNVKTHLRSYPCSVNAQDTEYNQKISKLKNRIFRYRLNDSQNASDVSGNVIVRRKVSYIKQLNIRPGFEDIEISIPICDISLFNSTSQTLRLSEAQDSVNLGRILDLANKYTVNTRYQISSSSYGIIECDDGNYVYRQNHNGTHSARQARYI